MSILKRFAPLLILATGLALAIAIANGKPKPQPATVSPVPTPQVDILTLQPQTTVLSVRGEGTVKPKRDITLVAEVGGRILKVSDDFADGATVSAGDVLLEIDPADYQTEVIRAQARVAEAEQVLALEKGRARQSKREWRDLGSDEANDLFLRKPQIKAAKAALAAASAELRKAELNLERTRIRAPFDGRLYNLQANLGQFVSSGTPITNLFDSSVAEVILPLSERQLRLLDLPLAASAPVDVTVHARLGSGTFERTARLVRNAARLDSDTRQLAAIVEISQPFTGPQPLYAGQFVDIHLPSKPLDNVVVLHQSLVHPRDTLWLLDDSNTLQIQPVTVLQAFADKVAVQMPDSQPINLVTSYLANPVEGMALTPHFENESSVQTAKQLP